MICCENNRCARIMTMADKLPYCRKCRAVKCLVCDRPMISPEGALFRMNSVSFDARDGRGRVTEYRCPLHNM